jgi:hypothetical protein
MSQSRVAPTGAAFVTPGALSLDSIVADQLSADVNDYAPRNIADADAIFLTAIAPVNISGLTSGIHGRPLRLFVRIGSQPVTLLDASVLSAAANRFSFGANVTVQAGSFLDLFYDAISARWYGAIVPVSGISVGPAFTLGTITPPALPAGNTNDYAPAGFATARILLLTVNAAGSILTGLAGVAPGRDINLVYQDPAGSSLTLKHASAASAIANRFACPGDVDLVLSHNAGANLWYDAAQSHWHVNSWA